MIALDSGGDDKMKKCLFVLLIFVALVLTACGANGLVEEEYTTISHASTTVQASFTGEIMTLENSLELATDIVIVQYVSRRPFGERLTEFELIVLDRIMGDAPDRIFVYCEGYYSQWFANLTNGTEYMLALRSSESPYAHTHIDGYTFIRNIIIDLDNPSNSTMRSMPLYQQSEGLNTSASWVDRQYIISYIADLISDMTPPVSELIRSDVLKDIVYGSPNVVVVEISHVLSLSDGTSDWMSTDIFYATVVDSVKGDMTLGTEITLIFFAGTVDVGEQHLVAIRQNDGGNFFRFTSRDSHFCVTQLDEIKQIIQDQNPLPTFTLTFNLYGGQPQANFPPQTITAGTTATEPLYNPTRNGYTFTGWFTDATGGTAFNFATLIYTDTTVHAQWEVIPLTPFTLTLDPRGGTVSTSTITVPQGSPVGSLPRPVLSGREFVGWYYMPEVGERERILPTTVIDRDITASAVWHVTITLDPMGGIFLNCVMRGTPLLPLGDYQYLPAEIYDEFGGLHTFTAEPGTLFGSHLLTPYMTGVQFAGWFTGVGMPSIPNPIIQKTEESIVPDNNMTLFARWGRGAIGSDPGRPPMGGQDFMIYDPYDALQDSEPDND